VAAPDPARRPFLLCGLVGVLRDFLVFLFTVTSSGFLAAAAARTGRSRTMAALCQLPRAVRTVYFAGSSPFLTWFQPIGIETVAPSRARGDKGATAVAFSPLRR
jgi:hypothetical protein